MNFIQVAGRLGADPEKRVTPNGQVVYRLRVASNVRESSQDITMWYDVSFWGENPIIPHLKKGSAVFIVGELKKPDIWTDRNGQQQIGLRVRADVIRFSPFGGKGDKGQEGGAIEQPAAEAAQARRAPSEFMETQAAYTPGPVYGQGGDSSLTDDDLPF